MDTPNLDVRCPRCGKKTRHYRKYLDGSTLYIHRQKKVMRPFPHMLITDACSDEKGVPG